MFNLKGALVSLCVGLCVALVSAGPALAQRPAAQSPAAQSPAVALKGFDPVAYFTDSRAVKGSSEFAHDWDDARYHFANAKHRATFVADPERYAPQFGALCATGLSVGKRITADPEIWRVVDGKLYIFSSTRARDMADKDPSLLDRSRKSHAAAK